MTEKDPIAIIKEMGRRDWEKKEGDRIVAALKEASEKISAAKVTELESAANRVHGGLMALVKHTNQELLCSPYQLNLGVPRWNSDHVLYALSLRRKIAYTGGATKPCPVCRSQGQVVVDRNKVRVSCACEGGATVSITIKGGATGDDVDRIIKLWNKMVTP